MAIISRSNAAALVNEQVSTEILSIVETQSVVMKLGRRLRNMATNVTRMPVLSALPVAYFVDGDTGLKTTSNAAWENKYLNAEELAVIIPIPDNVLDDASYDIWGYLKPLVASAFGKAFDTAVLVGPGPSSWPDDLLTACGAVSHSVDHSSATGDWYDEILGTSGITGLIEADGFMANGYIAEPTMRANLRGLRSESGGGFPIFMRSMQDSTRYELDGSPIEFVQNGAFSSSDAHIFVGDWTQLVYSMRQDITFKLLTEATIQDNAGNTIYNLAQQDMVAMRFVMRVAWQVANPINQTNPASTRFPFAVVVP